MSDFRLGRWGVKGIDKAIPLGGGGGVVGERGTHVWEGGGNDV